MTSQDALEQYEALINLHQFDAVAPLIAEDPVFRFNDGSFSGTEAIRGAFERTWRSFADETYWLTDRRWIAVGDEAASCLYQFNWTATVSGKRASGIGRGTTVLRKTVDGWKIVHEHLSGVPSK